MAVTVTQPKPTRRTTRRRGRRSEVANKIRAYRLDGGMSPEAFGRRVGLSGTTIRRIEDGRANTNALHPRTKLHIADEMGERVSVLWPM